MIKIKRVYDAAEPDDGFRVLVDALWPRGMKKEAARADLWAKDLAPSTGLRTWFHHDPDKWDEFRRLYLKELEETEPAWRPLVGRAKSGTVTLLYGARDRERNQAVVLKEFLESRMAAA